MVIATHAALLQDWPNHAGVVTMLALLVSARTFGLHVPHARAIAVGALWPAAIAALILVTPYGEAGLSDWFYPSLLALLVLGWGHARGARHQRAAACSGTC